MDLIKEIFKYIAYGAAFVIIIALGILLSAAFGWGLYFLFKLM